jgi:hypothetical protein
VLPYRAPGAAVLPPYLAPGAIVLPPAFAVHGTPDIQLFAIDGDEHFIERDAMTANVR